MEAGDQLDKHQTHPNDEKNEHRDGLPIILGTVDQRTFHIHVRMDGDHIGWKTSASPRTVTGWIHRRVADRKIHWSRSLCDLKRRKMGYKYINLSWQIWKTMWKSVFNGRRSDLIGHKQSHLEVNEFNNRTPSFNNDHPRTRNTLWIAPEIDAIKLSYDALWCPRTKIG